MADDEPQVSNLATPHPVDVLHREHEVILQVLEAVGRMSLRTTVRAGPFWREALAFLADYADRCHHGKEEELLFPALAEWGLPFGMGPIAVMEQQHVEARSLLQAMHAALTSPAELAAAARRYVALMREHIDIENDVLFPIARHTLPANHAVQLLQRFARAEAALGGGFVARAVEHGRTACDLAGVPFAAVPLSP